MIKVSVIDDHAALRKGIETILSDDMQCVLSAGSLDDYFNFEEKEKIDVIVLDLNLSDLPGATVITKILELSPDAKIVVYSMRDSIAAISSCYAAGAFAFVSKLSDTQVLIDAIETVSGGDYYYESGRIDQIATFAHVSKSVDPKELLKNAEFELFILLAEGKSEEEASEILNITVKTVKNRVTKIKHKLNIPLNRFTQKAREFNLIN